MDNKTIAALARLKDFLEKISAISLDSGAASDNVLKKLLSINDGLKKQIAEDDKLERQNSEAQGDYIDTWEEERKELGGPLTFDESYTWTGDDEAVGESDQSSTGDLSVMQMGESGSESSSASDLLFDEESIKNLLGRFKRGFKDSDALQKTLSAGGSFGNLVNHVKQRADEWSSFASDYDAEQAAGSMNWSVAGQFVSEAVRSGEVLVILNDLKGIFDSSTALEKDKLATKLLNLLLGKKSLEELSRAVSVDATDLSQIAEAEGISLENLSETKKPSEEEAVEVPEQTFEERVEEVFEALSNSPTTKDSEELKRLVEGYEKTLSENGRLHGLQKENRKFINRYEKGELQLSSKIKSLQNSLSFSGDFFDYPEESSFRGLLDKASDDLESELDFSESIFSNAGSKVRDGFQVISTEDAGGVIDIDTDDLSLFIDSNLQRLIKEIGIVVKTPTLVLADDDVDFSIRKSNEYRRVIALSVDDFISSLIHRDMVISRDPRLFENKKALSRVKSIPLLVANKSFSAFAKSLTELVRPNVIYGWYINSNLPENGDLDNFKTDYLETLYDTVEQKIDYYLKNYTKLYGTSIVGFLDKNINLGFIKNRALGFKKERLTRQTVECNLCGSYITLRYEWAGRIKGMPLLAKEEKLRYEDPKLNYQPYSLTRVDRSTGVRSLISMEEIQAAGEFSLSPKESAKVSLIYGASDSIDQEHLPKTWQEMTEDYLSGNEKLAQEAVLRKSFALRSLGAEKAGGIVNLTTVRLKCPFSSAKSFKDFSGKEVVESCGLGASPNPSVLQREGVTARDVLSTLQPSPFSSNNEALLEGAVKAGRISLDEAKMIEDRISQEVLSNGGWKFSKKSFICPTIIDPENFVKKEGEDEAAFESRVDELIGKHKKLVTPNKGPLPKDMYGAKKGSLSYLMCGALTSVSQFDRSELKGLIDSFVKGSETTPGFVGNIVSSLIEWGVDPQDLVTLIRVSEDPALASKASSSDRILKISGFLATAMAVRYQSKINKKMLNSIRDLTLICRHGHSFKIGDSIDFVNNHKECMNLSFNSSSGGRMKKRAVLDSGILSSSGEENKLASLGFSFGSERLFSEVPADIAAGIANGVNSASNPDPFTVKFSDSYWVDPLDSSKAYFSGPLLGRSKHSYSLAGGPRLGVGEVYEARTAALKTNAGGTMLAKSIDEAYVNTSFDASLGGTDDGGPGLTLYDTVAAEGSTDEGLEMEDDIVRLSNEAANYIRTYLFSIKDFLSAAVSEKGEGKMGVYYKSKERKSFSEIMDGNAQFDSALNNLIIGVLGDAEAPVLENVASNFRGLISGLNERESAYYINLDEGFYSSIWKWLAEAVVRSTDDNSSLRAKIIRRGPSGTIVNMERSGAYLDKIKMVAESLDYLSGQGPDIYGEIDPTRRSRDILKLRESDYVKSITMAAMAFSLAHQLAYFYRAYYTYGSPSFIGKSPTENFNFSKQGSSYGAISIPFDNIDRYYRDIVLTKQDLSGKNKQLIRERLLELNRDLTTEYRHVISMCRSSHWRSLGLKYIADTYGERIQQEEDPVIRNKLSLVLEKVMSNPGGTAIPMGEESKYLKRFSSTPEMFPALVGFTVHNLSHKLNSTSLKKMFRGDIVEDKDEINEERLVVGPIFRLSKENASGFNLTSILGRLGKSDEELYRSGSVILARVNEEEFDLVVKKMNALFQGESEVTRIRITDREGDIAQRFPGWILFFTNIPEDVFARPTKPSGIKDRDAEYYDLSLANHPATIIREASDGSVYYENEDVGLSSKDGFYIGSYGSPKSTDLCYPPANASFINRIGIPIPITADPHSPGSFPRPKEAEKAGIEKRLSPVAARIFVTLSGGGVDGSYDIPVNLTDFLQRDDPQTAWRYLSEILRSWNMFKERVAELESEEEIKFYKKEFVERSRGLFTQYRALPFYVKKSYAARTHRSARTDRFGENKYSDSPRYGWYIPLVNSTIMNMLIEEECFHPDWGGHTGWEVGLSQEEIMEIKRALKDFTVRVNGLDKLAEILNENERGKIFIKGSAPTSPAERLTGEDLLDPYSLFHKRYNKVIMRDGSGKAIVGEDGKVKRDKVEVSRTGILNPKTFGLEIGKGTVVDGNLGKYVELDGGVVAKNKKWVFDRLGHTVSQFFPISGLNYSEENSAGSSYLIMPTTGFIKEANQVARFSAINDTNNAQELLAEADVSGDLIDTSYKMLFGHKSKKDRPFAELFRAWIQRRLSRARESVEETYKKDPDEFPDITSGFGREAEEDLLMSKVSAKVINGGFIKKSEKYKTNIFSETIIIDEELSDLFNSA